MNAIEMAKSELVDENPRRAMWLVLALTLLLLYTTGISGCNREPSNKMPQDLNLSQTQTIGINFTLPGQAGLSNPVPIAVDVWALKNDVHKAEVSIEILGEPSVVIVNGATRWSVDLSPGKSQRSTVLVRFPDNGHWRIVVTAVDSAGRANLRGFVLGISADGRFEIVGLPGYTHRDITRATAYDAENNISSFNVESNLTRRRVLPKGSQREAPVAP